MLEWLSFTFSFAAAAQTNDDSKRALRRCRAAQDCTPPHGGVAGGDFIRSVIAFILFFRKGAETLPEI
jgi:hypothetical protein